MRVFVTGIEGFVGRHLSAALRDEGYRVRGSALTADSGAEGAVPLDVRDADQVERVIAEAAPETLFHLAGEASVAASFRDPVRTFEVNASGALNVLEACRRTGVRCVILVTSCEVYGDPDPQAGPVPENRAMAPISPYGASKAAQDLLGEQYARTFGLRVVRVRSFPHTGPGQRDTFLFPSVARRIVLAEAGLGPARAEVGDVEVVRDLLDVRDVVRAYVRLMETGRPGVAYNVCGGRGRSLREALEALCALARCPVRLVVDPSRRRPTDARWMVGDPSRLMTETGWEPSFGWRETVHDLLEDVRARVSREIAEAERA